MRKTRPIDTRSIAEIERLRAEREDTRRLEVEKIATMVCGCGDVLVRRTAFYCLGCDEWTDAAIAAEEG